MERKSGKSILKQSTTRKDKAMKTPAKTDAKDEVKRDEPRYDPIQRAPDRNVTSAKSGFADVEEFASHRDPLHKPKQADPREQINEQIADHEKWMNDHTDDARGVQERLQQIAVLHSKLVELDQPKHETRARQAQTV